MALPILERYRTENETKNKKFHYDIKSLKLHNEIDYVYYTCEIIADRDIEVDYTLGIEHHKHVIPKGARGGRVWVDSSLAEQYLKEHKLSAEFDFKGGLSQRGSCWVGHDCLIGPGSFVNDDAIVINKSKLINVHIGHRVVVDKSEIICADPELSVVANGHRGCKILRGGTSSIMNDCQVSHSVVKETYLNMEDCSKLLYTTLEKKEGCKGGLSTKGNVRINHCNLKTTGNDNIFVSEKYVSDKTIEGYGPYNGANITITRNITD